MKEVAKGYPDWATNVIQKEGTAFVVTGNVDANITNAEIDAHVTNSKISIEPAEGSEFVIKPAQSAIFNVQGSVDANITNSSLNVHVTNSSLNVDANITNSEITIKPAQNVVFDIQGSVDITGTASVSIDNATVSIDVATIRERASEQQKVFYVEHSINFNNQNTTTYLEKIYTNNTSHTVFLEQILSALYCSAAKNNGALPSESLALYIRLMEPGTAFPDKAVVEIPFNWDQAPVNFDPAIPVPPNYSIEFYANIDQYLLQKDYNLTVTLIMRQTPQ